MHDTDYFQTQRELDAESRRLMLEWQLEQLPIERLAIHYRYNHVLGRCRCLDVK